MSVKKECAKSKFGTFFPFLRKDKTDDEVDRERDTFFSGFRLTVNVSMIRTVPELILIEFKVEGFNGFGGNVISHHAVNILGVVLSDVLIFRPRPIRDGKVILGDAIVHGTVIEIGVSKDFQIRFGILGEQVFEFHGQVPF